MKKFVGAIALLLLASVPAVILRAESRPARRYIHVEESVKAPFSDGVLAGGTLYVSGRLGLDPKTKTIPASVDDELRFLFESFESVLRAADMTTANLVSVQVFCPDLTLYDTFNAAYRARFQGEFPARAFIGSGPLLRGARFEITGVAVRDR